MPLTPEQQVAARTRVEEALEILIEHGDGDSMDAVHALEGAQAMLMESASVKDMTFVVKVDTAYTDPQSIEKVLNALTGVLVMEVHQERMTS